RAFEQFFRCTPPTHVVACRERRGHARLQQRELLERSAVEWQIATLFVVDESADGTVCPGHARRLAGDAALCLYATDVEREIEDDRLADVDLNAAAHERAKSTRHDVDLVTSGRKDGNAIPPSGIRRQLAACAGRDVHDEDLRVRKG